MTQKFMLFAIAGYVFFAGIASIFATLPAQPPGLTRQFVIILARWGAIIAFATASIAGALHESALNRADSIWGTLRPLTDTLPPLWLVPFAVIILLALPVFLNRVLDGWWSPLQWLQGLVGATALGLWAGASEGPLYTVIPDWRFIGASIVLWLVCLLVGDVALLISNGNRPMDRVSECYRELLRLCSAAPPILIYLIGFQL